MMVGNNSLITKFEITMEYFLQNIAKNLYGAYGDELDRHCLVFPNRRAGLYFMKYLSSVITRPAWSPGVYTINELFSSYSSLRTASSEILLFELYKVYRKIRQAPEKFDDFYFWGDMLLNDFDDVDKYIVDARMLFNNVVDLKNIDRQFGELTPEQIEVIRRFWINFDPDRPTKQKNSFVDIWSALLDLYTEFRKALRSKAMAYEGMIFRDLAESAKEGSDPEPDWKMIHFIGFNALNECEKVLMKGLKKRGKAKFYWDYDNTYIGENKINSAGYFMRNNLLLFGNDMSPEWKYDTYLSENFEEVKRTVIETSSDVAQVKLLPELIRKLPGLSAESAHHTAIVLSDENLLIPVLTSLPEDTGDVNVTMGYPLRQTLVYTFIRHLMDLQRNSSSSGEYVRFGHRDVLNVLKHPLAETLASQYPKEVINEIIQANLLWVPGRFFAGKGNLEVIFAKPLTAAVLSAYFRNILSLAGSLSMKGTSEGMADQISNEFLYRAALAVNRLESIISQDDVEFSCETYMKILDKVLKLQSVPFSGEPLSGIQVMGILETRALDFTNLIILSVNEGIMPSVSSASSFIPFNLREAFGLPSVNHQESIYAYHFYRLLHRAEHVTFLYNSNSDGLKTGEMSRFLNQMKYDEKLKPEFQNLSFEIRSHGAPAGSVARTEIHRQRLIGRFTEKGRVLSPSAINTWLGCSMRFYYRYVNDLKEPEVVSGDIDPAMLGEILHGIMQTLYSEYMGKVLTENAIDSLIADNARLESIIIASIDLKFKGGHDRRIEGTELIIREVLKAYVVKILKFDRSLAPLALLDLEGSRNFEMSLSAGDKVLELLIGGVVDRIDRIGGNVRVVDYKTGSVATKIDSIGDLFEADRSKDFDAWLQTLLYCESLLSGNPDWNISPSVYKIKKMSGSLSDRLRIKTDPKNDTILEDYRSVREEFLSYLKQTVADIFSADAPFVMTEDIRGKCNWCPYRGLCAR